MRSTTPSWLTSPPRLDIAPWRKRSGCIRCWISTCDSGRPRRRPLLFRCCVQPSPAIPAWRRLPRPLLTTEVSRLLLTDLISALMLLTRLPVTRFARAGEPPDLARCVWAFPLAGVVVNGIGGLVYWLAHRFGVSPLLAAAWTLAATMVITGGFHEDGLAD